MELARNLAETVSHVRDPLMRGEIASRVAARLGVPAADFENLLVKQTRVETQSPQSARPAAAAAPPHNVALLCLFALRDEAAREFLREQNWREILAQTPNAELLLRILEAEFRRAMRRRSMRSWRRSIRRRRPWSLPGCCKGFRQTLL